MTDLHADPEFEDELRRAMRSYAAEGLRSFDPDAIRAKAVAPGARSWWRGASHPRPFAMSALRLAVVVVLLAAAVGALAVAGARLLTPTPPIPGALALGGTRQIVLVDPSSKITRALTLPIADDNYPVWSPDGMRIAFSQTDWPWGAAVDGRRRGQPPRDRARDHFRVAGRVVARRRTDRVRRGPIPGSHPGRPVCRTHGRDGPDDARAGRQQAGDQQDRLVARRVSHRVRRD